MKIAYFGYDFFSRCLETLVDEKHEIVGVFSHETDNHYNFNANIEMIANNIGVNVSKRKVTANDIVGLHNNGCELIVSAAYPYKISTLDTHPVRDINIHPTLLPMGRGPWPLPYVILNQLDRSGVTIHKITNNMDAGDILIQQAFAVSEGEDLETLSCKCQMLAPIGQSLWQI